MDTAAGGKRNGEERLGALIEVARGAARAASAAGSLARARRGVPRPAADEILKAMNAIAFHVHLLALDRAIEPAAAHRIRALVDSAALRTRQGGAAQAIAEASERIAEIVQTLAIPPRRASLPASHRPSIVP